MEDENKKMKCPYLEVEPVPRCLAYTEGIRIVRDVDMENFCCNIHYKNCNIYIGRETKGNRSIAAETTERG